MPAGQGVHDTLVAPPMEYEPEAHSPEQDAVVAPVAEPYVPAGHCVHVGEDALPVEYEPAGQGAVHADVVKPDDAP